MSMPNVIATALAARHRLDAALAVRCARAAGGHAAAPPRSVMKSRRFS
jgi:hypothetical protein